MQPLIYAAIALLTATAADDTANAPAPIPVAGDTQCQNPEVTQVDRLKPAIPHTLDREPAARRLYTVLNSVDGCVKPIYVNEQFE